jgi:2-amino-4-hydroxy-6-hydroxymethyldihydropteridine diphosphokinase
MTRCLIALGGNVGDVPATFASALRRLAGPDLRVTAVSRLYETPPMGVAAGGTFLNAVAAVETSLSAESLLDRLLAIEEALGRVRTVHWGPRPIDLDLILFGETVIDTPRLRVPHPAAWYRRFVLDPTCDIAAEAVHPEAGATFTALRDRLAVRPLPMAVDGPSDAATVVADWLRRASGELEVVTPGVDPALTIWVGTQRSSATERVIGVRADGTEADAVQAIVAAVLGVPQPVGNVAFPTDLGL